MRINRLALGFSLMLTMTIPAKVAFAVCAADSTSADVLPVGHIAGTGAITSDCRGRLIDGVETINTDGQICQGKLAGTYSLNQNGTGTVSFSLIPYDVSVICPIVNFNEAIAVGQSGQIVKAINTDDDEVTIQEEWVRQN